jgi:hypothetical protein
MLGVLGGLITVVFGVIFAVNNLIGEILDLSLLGFSIVGNTLGESGWLVTAAVMIVCGLIEIYGYKELSGKKKGALLLCDHWDCWRICRCPTCTNRSNNSHSGLFHLNIM